MDGLALALVLGAAGFHAGWNVALRDAGDRVAAVTLACLFDALLLAPGLVLSPPRGVMPLVPISAVAEAVYVLALGAAYGRGQLSLAYPIGRGTAPFLVTLGGWVIVSERPTLHTVAGALLLGAGLVVLARAGRGPALPAVGFALLAGVAIASYSVIDARAVRRVSPPGYLSLVFGLAGLITLAVMRFDLGRLRRSLRPGVVIALGSVAAYLLVLFAVRRSPVGQVATVRECSVLIGILVARESPGRAVWLGAAFVVAGVVLAAV